MTLEVTFTVNDERADNNGEDVTFLCDELTENPMQPDQFTAYTDGERVTGFAKTDLNNVESVQ